MLNYFLFLLSKPNPTQVQLLSSYLLEHVGLVASKSLNECNLTITTIITIPIN